MDLRVCACMRRCRSCVCVWMCAALTLCGPSNDGSFSFFFPIASPVSSSLFLLPLYTILESVLFTGNRRQHRRFVVHRPSPLLQPPRRSINLIIVASSLLSSPSLFFFLSLPLFLFRTEGMCERSEARFDCKVYLSLLPARFAFLTLV